MAKAKFQDRELTIEDAVSEACGELCNLGEEMRDAFDNTPESLQQSGVGEARGEAADALENIQEPNVPQELQGDKFKVKWQTRILSTSAQLKQSRSSRRDDAVETLNAVLQQLQDDEKMTDEEKNAATDFIDELENIISEAEGVSFPGMYG